MALESAQAGAKAGMRLIDRYLGRTVILGSVLALTILAAIASLLEFINEVEDVDSGYSLLQAVFYVLLTLPQRIYDLFPTAVLVGSLMSLGGLAANSELVVIRAAGVSIPRIIWSVLKAGLAITVIAVLLGEWAAPEAGQRARNLQNASQSERTSLRTGDGLWAKDGQRFINVRSVYPGLRLSDLRIYRFDGQRLVRATHARSAVYEEDHWILRDVRHSAISPNGVEARRKAQERWERLLPPALFNVLTADPERMPAWVLYRYIGYLEENELDADTYKLAFWTHFTTPLSALVMLLLAVPFAFGSWRASGAGQRLFIGIVIGLVFYLFNQMFNHLSLVYGLTPWMGAFLPIMMFLVIGLVALRRVR